MSLYSEQLAKLKKELAVIMSKKTKKLSSSQKSIYLFIQGKTDRATFNCADKTVVLMAGDDKKGFRHILEKHFYPNDLEAMDILNMMDICKRGMKLNEVGVSNQDLTVYMSLKNQKEHRLVLNEVRKNFFVVTAYKKG
ncbi:hypothetical protein FJR48_08120 [Sulfurimonas lithotrophica]|uniref:Uncharacterized protein n=1 Tax=Sulfurimonas lithotrophica TaxID=2590022 RepID=A0A5P8P2A2_9BACT|nr:hypothetical protein [Sulfurimonas lithotrophica]QFR49700.1 hypothetical protein FJR48_08120 [Sulfurimonas lithotrophica]